MRLAGKLILLSAALTFPAALQALPARAISTYAKAPSPVRYAADRLSSYTGIPLARSAAREVRITLVSSPNPGIGTQGYTIRSAEGLITISGNDAEGAANGVYTFLRTLMIEHRKDPFSRDWNIAEKPAFSVREMQIAPYRFGASYGFAVFSPDRWTFEEWKRYVDFMRLCNMTTLDMASQRVYDPAYPQSDRDQWRYEVWKKVMDYCHQVGIKFNWFISPNLVTEQAFWDNPDKRAIQDEGPGLATA